MGWSGEAVALGFLCLGKWRGSAVLPGGFFHGQCALPGLWPPLRVRGGPGASEFMQDGGLGSSRAIRKERLVGWFVRPFFCSSTHPYLAIQTSLGLKVEHISCARSCQTRGCVHIA